MLGFMADPGFGKNRRDDSVSGDAILAAFIPTFTTALITLAIFAAIRNSFARVYAPRTFLGTIPERHRTPNAPSGVSWLNQFRSLTDHFVLQHNSLDAYLYLRFLRFLIWVCFLGCCLTFPVLIPLNATGGGNASQLDRISFSNIANNDHLWGHTVVAWLLFGGLLLIVAWERLRLIGIRQAYLLSEKYRSRLSARTVLFMDVPADACSHEKLRHFFGDDAERCWPSKDVGDLESLVQKRNDAAYSLESSQMDLTKTAGKLHKRTNGASTTLDPEQSSLVPKHQRPSGRKPPLVGQKFDKVEHFRDEIVSLNGKIESHRSSPGRNVPERASVFVAFKDQAAAHRAFQKISFQHRSPLKDRFLGPQPKEVLWNTITMPAPIRVSKASLGLAFVIAFTIFFSIPVGLIGTLSNIKGLADQYEGLAWIKKLSPAAIGLLSGFLPPFLISWFTSYVPKLFRHVAKLSGEPTTAQAELKTQAWYFAFQVIQVFLVTTFSSGAASVATQLAQHPDQAPAVLAANLPKASNFYLTWFILQGTASAADNLLDYSELLEYLFYEYIWNKTPREKFSTYSSMRGTPWASWYPKFTNFLVIALVYSTIAPLVLLFATIGIFFYYLSYRYSLLFIRQTKTDTRGEAYKRALQQIPTGIYLAEICLIGLFGARKATTQTALMVVLLVLTALTNLVLDRVLKPLELYLGVDIWQDQELSLAQQDGMDTSDPAALHAASHGRRLGLIHLPKPMPKKLSDFLDSIISSAKEDANVWIGDAQDEGSNASEDELKSAYVNPALISKTPKLWIPKDAAGASKQEIEQNEKAGIATTDEGAEFDHSGNLHWDHWFDNIPIWKEAKVW